jgi:hypothetical protein
MIAPETHPEDAYPQIHYVGLCRVCGTGSLGVRACGQCSDLVILCDECGTWWNHVRVGEKSSGAFSEEAPCPSCGYSLWERPSHWATAGEIWATGWLARALADGTLTLGVGRAFGDGG